MNLVTKVHILFKLTFFGWHKAVARQSKSNRAIMRSFTILRLIFVFFLTSQAMKEENVSKIVCTLSRFKEVDLVKGPLLKPIILSKKLFYECNIKLRIVTLDTEKIGQNDILLLANYGRDDKETL